MEGGGGGGAGTYFQLLMLIPNLLFNQIPKMVGEGDAGAQLLIIDAESKPAKKPKFLYGGGGGARGLGPVVGA